MSYLEKRLTGEELVALVKRHRSRYKSEPVLFEKRVVAYTLTGPRRNKKIVTPDPLIETVSELKRMRHPVRS